MARLDEDRIISVAEAFVAEHGRTPTYEELQEKLGVRSPTTLNKYYRPWRSKRDAELKAQQSPPPAEILPLPDALLQTLVSAWSSVVAETRAEARKEIEEAQSDLSAQREQLLADLAERDATISALETQGEANQEAFDAERAELRAQIQIRADEVASRTTELTHISELLSAERQKTAMLTSELDLARQETAAERTKANTLAIDTAGLAADLKRLTADLEASRRDVEAERTRADVATARLEGLSGDIQRLTETLESERRRTSNMAAPAHL